MGKSTAMWGKTSGKVGGLVYSTSGGETIVREYNGNVSNPNTQAQVNQRARLKLMSQLSAAMAPVIAIPKKGLISARNQFTKMNFEQSMAQDGVAQITYENIQLTNGNLGLPSIEASRAQGSGISVNLSEDAHLSVDRVVYILYRKTTEQRLQYVTSVVVEAAGANGMFAATLPYTEGDIVLYAYGMRDTSESASAKYGNMQVANAVDVARLTAYRNISSEDYQFTETRGATMYADQSEITPVPEGSARVFVTAFGGGSVSGGGIYVIGQNATIVATANEGYSFAGWRDNGTQEIVSSEASYTFEVTGQTDLVAVFTADVPGSTYTINLRTARSAPSENTLVRINNREFRSTDSITIPAGTQITIEASAGEEQGINFVRWALQDSTEFATANPYTFTPNGSMTIIALWQQGGL